MYRTEAQARLEQVLKDQLDLLEGPTYKQGPTYDYARGARDTCVFALRLLEQLEEPASKKEATE